MLQDVDDDNIDAVRAFLEPRVSTSIFLLYCLQRHGPRLGGHHDSGNMRCIIEDGQVVAVCSATRRGHLLVETGGRTDLWEPMSRAARIDGIRIDGVVAEWAAAQSIWPVFRDREGFRPVSEARHVAYSLRLDPSESAPEVDGVEVRLLGLPDFDIWYPLFHALEEQEGLEIHGTKEDIRARFAYTPWRWYGAFMGGDLAAVGCLDLSYRDAGHVGGIYVAPNHRRKGLARTIVLALAHDGQARHRLGRLILYARENHAPARRLYEGMGFEPAGHFGFLVGVWDDEALPPAAA